MNATITAQKKMCERYRTAWVPAPDHLKLGIARNVRSGLLPLNGMRHPPHGDTTGWYIWAGEELSTESEFFEPLHVVHLSEWCPTVLHFLGLPPGWRFLKAGDCEDVWEDPALLE